MAEKDLDVKELAGVLGTEDAEQQMQVIKNLVEMAQAPVITMTVVLDTRTSKTDILLNGRFSFDEIYTLLDVTRREVNRREREAIIQQKEQS